VADLVGAETDALQLDRDAAKVFRIGRADARPLRLPQLRSQEGGGGKLHFGVCHIASPQAAMSGPLPFWSVQRAACRSRGRPAFRLINSATSSGMWSTRPALVPRSGPSATSRSASLS